MDMEIKEKILQTSERLFRERGYAKVTMRDIAGALDISVGNLTYHFHKKQDIANTLLIRELEILAEDSDAGLAALDRYLRSMVCSLVEHTRMYGDPLLVSVMNGREAENAQRVRQLKRRLLQLLEHLQGGGLILPQTAHWQLEDLAEILMAAHIGWQQQTLLESQENPRAVDRIMHAQWTILVPFLTQEGLAQLTQLCQDKPEV